MSSILDALEKAHRKRRKSGTGLAPEELAEAERRERQILDESSRHRRTFLLLVFGIGMLALLLFAAITGLVYLTVSMRYDGSPQVAPQGGGQGAPQVAAVPGGENMTTATPAPTPTPSAVVEAEVESVSAVVAAATPEVEVTPTPTPDATQTPEPSPTATATPEPTPAPRFAHMQVVYDEELGVNIRGVIADGSSSIIMIDDTTVSLGRRYGKIRPIRIENRMIEAEYDQNGEEITLFIRW